MCPGARAEYALFPMLSAVLAVALCQMDMTPMLAKGPLVLVEEGKASKFGQSTAIVLIDAPVEQVWTTLLKMDEFKSFMPKVTTSDLSNKTATTYDLHVVLDVPGPDTDYVVRYTPDAAKHEIDGVWSKGDLKDSHWHWKLEGAPDNKTLLSHTLAVKNFSSLAQSLEDDSQTITVGINVSSALAAAKAMKKRCEEQKKNPPAAANAPAAAQK